jgi:D-alanyl-D-alanine endopeptidase (penicillin-binding protein 7)
VNFRILAVLYLCYSASALALPLGSAHVLVLDEDSGAILLEKNAQTVVPIASLTKLMTAMVVLDSKPDMDEIISIDQSDVDVIKHSSSHVPVGAMLPRRAVLQLALMSSDNRAAAALARNYPGGSGAFVAAVHAKQAALGMTHTTINEPTGLSPGNISTAIDLAKMAAAASKYPEIARITTDTHDVIDVNGRPVDYHNTNRLGGQTGWSILLSKTGFTSEAGRCLIMRMQSAGRNVIMVLLNAKNSVARSGDALKVRRFLAGETTPLVRVSSRKARRVTAHHVRVKRSYSQRRASKRIHLAKIDSAS